MDESHEDSFYPFLSQSTAQCEGKCAVGLRLLRNVVSV